MIDKLKQFLEVEKEDEFKLNVIVSDKLPLVLYGDESGIIKIVLYFFNLISSISNNKNISLVVEDIKVGNFSRLKFKFITNDKSILNYVIEDKETKELKLNKVNDINYEIIENLLEKMNGKITITKNEESINLTISVNQKLASEYDIISDKEENKNIKIKYHDYSNRRILIVDNNKLKIKEIKTLLKPYNIETISTNTLSEMADILSDNETFDMIIIDDIIPDSEINKFIKNQNDILNYIKKYARYNIITIIMVTKNNKNIEEKYIDCGFNDYIIKPINKKNIDEILNKYFNNRK